MKFAIITNELKDPGLEITNRITSLLDKKGISYKLLKKAEDFQADIDIMMVLGGDGTMLQAARENAGKNIPMIGINLGTLGFLSEVEIENIEEAIDKLINKEYEEEQRMMLCGEITGNGKRTVISPALNDISITRSGSLQIISLNIFVNGKLLCNFNADGIIISTPTGSTGYNMSAGGPIVEPGADLILITPICAHTLNARSIVLRSDDIVEVEVPAGRLGRSQTVEANSDGNERIAMETGDRIRIYKAKETTTILKLSKMCFLEILHKKMGDTK
ncbi:MAG: NAD(+)/NADH kinase [Lachnospiraceae bacterium]|nr:NAD(+)/NADH kinase [Lachnospiraceae bacterium]